MDGGVGVILRNKGRGMFEAIPPARSGFVVPGDAKSLDLSDLTAMAAPTS